MDTKKLIILITCLLVVSYNAMAQQTATKAIRIGDTIPDIVLTNILDRKTGDLRPTDLYKHGMLIINFWATWCMPCVKEVGYLDSLRARHKDRFQVLSVTQESEKIVRAFQEGPANQNRRMSNLFVKVRDTTLQRLFPHRGIPHNIWIDSTGVVRAITSGEEMTADNILNFYKTITTKKLVEKRDRMSFSRLAEFHLGDSSFSYRSIITPHIAGIGGGMMYDAENGMTNRYTQTNGAISHLYWSAYSGFIGEIRYQLMEIHTRDSLRIFHPSGKRKHLLSGSKYAIPSEWSLENTYCYALTLPKRVSATVIRDYMLNDLNRQFGYMTSLKMKKIICRVVEYKKSAVNPLVQSKDSISSINWSGTKWTLRGVTIDYLMKYIDQAFNVIDLPDPYLIDMERDKFKRFDMDLDFTAEVMATKGKIQPQMVFDKLAQYGFSFRFRKRPYPILVIREAE